MSSVIILVRIATVYIYIKLKEYSMFFMIEKLYEDIKRSLLSYVPVQAHAILASELAL